jgi:hypothetical protein
MICDFWVQLGIVWKIHRTTISKDAISRDAINRVPTPLFSHYFL